MRAAQVLPNSPASRAGIVEGDRVTSVDGKRIEAMTGDQVRALLDNGQPGRKVKVGVVRDGQTKTMTMTLEEAL